MTQLTFLCPCTTTYLPLIEEHKLYRPKSTSEPAPGKFGALKSYIDDIESDIETPLIVTNQRVALTSDERRNISSALQRLKHKDNMVIKKETKDAQWLL